jgi:hypothetical protein
MAADSVIVAFPRVAKGADAGRAVVEYLEHRHVAGCAERDYQFTDERTWPGLAAAEGAVGQEVTGALDRVDGTTRDVQIAAGALQLTRERMGEESQDTKWCQCQFAEWGS